MIISRPSSTLAVGLPPTAEIDKLLDSAMDFTTNMIGAERCSLMLRDRGSQELVVKKARGMDESIIRQTRIRLGDGVSGWVAENRQNVFVENSSSFPELQRRYPQNYTTQSFVSVPIVTDDLLGVLNATDKRDNNPFSNADLVLMEQMAALIGELLQLQEKTAYLQRLSFVDPLTGLGNRSFFEVRLTQEMARVERYNQELSVLLIDIDQLRDLNMANGHQAGNEALRHVASCLGFAIRQSDVAVRYGDDEFAIILSPCESDAAEIIATRLVETLSQPSSLSDTLGQLSVSIGISSYPSLSIDKDHLVSGAEAALNDAKNGSTKNIATWQQKGDSFKQAQTLGIPYLESPTELLTPATAKCLPLDIARRHLCVPVGFDRGNVAVAMADPSDTELLQSLAQITRHTIHPMASSEVEILTALRQMAELLGMHSVIDVFVRPIGKASEMEIAVNQLDCETDIGKTIQELSSVCLNRGAILRQVESHVVVVNANSIDVAQIIEEFRQIEGLLVQSFLTQTSN